MPQTWAGCAYVVVVATFFSYMLIVVGQKSLRPTVAGMYNYIQPIVSCIVTICLGMDHFNLVKVGMLGRLLPNLSPWLRWVVGFWRIGQNYCIKHKSIIV